MFEKLLSLLPYNPGLASQMAFYAKRMNNEAMIRRTGMIFMILALMVQFFAVLNPPQPTLAASSNDLIHGGITSNRNAAAHCFKNTQGFKTILETYGIACNSLTSASTVNLSSGAHNGHLYSMGRNPQGGTNATTGRPTNEQGVNIGGNRLYWRKLNSWGDTSYKALKVTSSTGKLFYILYDCGNLVTVSIPTPVPKHEVCPWRNDRWTTSPDCFEPCPYNKNIPKTSSACRPPTETHPDPIRPVTVCQINPQLAADDPECRVCAYNSSLWYLDSRCVPPPTTEMCAFDSTIPADSPDCARCRYNNQIAASNPDCRPCDKSANSADAFACLTLHKSATNQTTGGGDANNTTASGGDVIHYTLSVKNDGLADIEDYQFEENLNDVLDYAEITDLHGGSLINGTVTWPRQTITAGQTATDELTVKIKTPVPQTPVSSSDPDRFDLNMVNVFGDTIRISLPGGATKNIEMAASTNLPNTGPGETLAVISAVVIFGGYFYSRSKLLAKESGLALKEMASA